MSNVVARMPQHHCKQEPVLKLGFSSQQNSAAAGHQNMRYFERARRGQAAELLATD